MSSKDNIYHQGQIEKIEGSKAEVKILQQSACGKCNAKSMCAVSDMKEKIIEVRLDSHQTYDVGDHVEIIMQRTMGMRAVLLAYFLPFVLVIATLVVILQLTKNELLAGLLALGILVPYYTIIWLLRDKMKKEFIFRIQ